MREICTRLMTLLSGMEWEERIYVGRQKELELIAAASSFFYVDKNLKQVANVSSVDSRWQVSE